jgi:hypothetical protein
VPVIFVPVCHSRAGAHEGLVQETSQGWFNGGEEKSNTLFDTAAKKQGTRTYLLVSNDFGHSATSCMRIHEVAE